MSQLSGISYLPSRPLYLALYRVDLSLLSFIYLNLSMTEGSNVFEQCEAETPALLWTADEVRRDSNLLHLRAWPQNPGIYISLR